MYWVDISRRGAGQGGRGRAGELIAPMVAASGKCARGWEHLDSFN